MSDVGEDCALLGATPNYPERLYPEDEEQNGGARLQCSPGGAWLFFDHVGRYFILRVPDLTPLDDAIPSVYLAVLENFIGVPPADAEGRLYIGDGTAGPSEDYIYRRDATALDVYGAVVSAVNAIAGHSIRWKMISDGRLK